MERTRAVRLTDYIVSTPPVSQSLILILAAAILFGILLTAVSPKAELITAVGSAVFLLVVPALLTTLTLKLFKRKLPLRQLLFLSALGSLVYAAFYLAALALPISGIAAGAGVVLVGFGLVFILWFLIAKVVFNMHRSSLIFAIIQLLYHSLFLLAAQYMAAITADPLSLLFKIYLASFVFLAALYLLFFLINAPMKRSFGVSSIDAVTMFLSQWLYQSKDLEEAFAEVGQEVETTVGVMGFRGKRHSALFIVPAVHFGPFGNLGGSEFSAIISDFVSAEHKATPFVFHGTATHDFDPVASDEVRKVNSAISKAISGFKHSPASGSFSIGKFKSCRALCLSVNNAAFIGLTRAPRTTEDINFAVGLALRMGAEKSVGEALIADAHNSETGEIEYVEPGSPLVFELEAAISDALKKKGKAAQLKMGTAVRELNIETFGRAGMRLALFESAGKFSAFLLLDSNGILPSFRRELLDSLAAHAKGKGIRLEAEVFTTDTHQVNAVRGVLNPAGSKHGEMIIENARGAFDEALSSLEPVSCAAATERFRINVLGAGQSTEILSTVSAVVAIVKIAAPLIMLGATIAILLGVAKL